MSRALLIFELLILGTLAAFGILLVMKGGGRAYDFAIFGLSVLPILILRFAILVTGNDLLNPLWGILVSVLFGTTIRTAYVIGENDTLIVEQLMSGQKPEALMPGLLIMVASIAALAVGYVFPRSGVRFRLDKLLPSEVRWSLPLLTLIVAATCIIGVIASIALVQISGDEVNSLETLSRKRQDTSASLDGKPAAAAHLVWAGLLPSYALLACVVVMTSSAAFARSYYLKFLIAFAILGMMVYPIMASERSPLLYAIISPLIVYVARRPIDFGFIKRLFAVTLASLIMLIALGELRKLNSQRRAQDIFRDDPQEMFLFWFAGTQNYADIIKVADIYRAVPSVIDYKYGMTFLNIVFAPIPRAYWADKPVISMGYEIKEKVYGKDTVRRGGPPPGFAVECLVNFGLLGIVPCGLVAGFFIRVYYNTFLPIVRENDLALLIYSTTYMTSFFSFYQVDFTLVLIAYLRAVASILVIVALSKIVSRRSVYPATFSSKLS